MSRFLLSSLFAAALLLAAVALPEPYAARLAWGGAALWFLGLAFGVVCIRAGWFGPVLCRGRGEGRRVALTFDDGPDPQVTPALLDLLRELGVRATFFCVGERVAAAPEVARRIVAEGHLIANHSHGHRWWTNFLLRGGLRRELSRAQRAIEAAAGVTPRFYRPPMGLTNPHLAGALRDTRLTLTGWDIRPFDRNARAPEALAGRIAGRARPGSVVLLHDGGVQPAPLLALVRALVPALRARGLEPGRVDEMLPEGGALPASGDPGMSGERRRDGMAPSA